MQFKTLHSPAIWLAAALLAGCSTQSAYQRPALEVPAQFKEATPEAAEAGIWRPADPSRAQVPDNWWELFGDEQLNRLQQQAATGNQSIAQAAARLRAAQAAVASSQAGLFPTLGSTAGATRSRSGGASGASGASGTGGNTGSSGNISTNYSLGLNASWELDLWGRVSGTVSASQASAQASSDDLAAARLSAQASITQTYFSLRAADASVRLLQETLQSYEQSLKLTNNRYRAGVASSADVAQAEAQYKSTQAQLIEAQTSRAQLEHALAALLGLPPAAFSLEAGAELPPPPEVPAMLSSQLLEQRPDIAAAERRVAAANAQVGVARAAFFPALTLSATAGYR
ncbi:efflux transporter outer membrane subunit, partial [Delftia acidovorans]